jgi:hypothetical protein
MKTRKLFCHIPMPASWLASWAGAGEKPPQRPDMMQIEAENTTA